MASEVAVHAACSMGSSLSLTGLSPIERNSDADPGSLVYDCLERFRDLRMMSCSVGIGDLASSLLKIKSSLSKSFFFVVVIAISASALEASTKLTSLNM